MSERTRDTMKEMEARKKLLVAESEVYRQTLRLDVQNLKLYSLRMKRKWAQYAMLKPLVMAGLPVASALFSSRKREDTDTKPRSLLATVLAGWRMYQRMQPVIMTLLAKYMAQRPPGEESGAEVGGEAAAETDSPAATI